MNWTRQKRVMLFHSIYLKIPIPSGTVLKFPFYLKNTSGIFATARRIFFWDCKVTHFRPCFTPPIVK